MNELTQELAKLSSLSSELEKTKVERKLKADTKKNRQALLKACQEKNLDELRRLIDLDVPLNFSEDVASTGATWRTLLGIASRENWVSGVTALLEAGANEESIEGYLENPKNESALCIAARMSHLGVYTALFPCYSEERQKASIAHVRHPALLATLEAHGKGSLIEPSKIPTILASCVPHLDPGKASETGNSAACSVFETLAARSGLREEGSEQARETLWRIAILSNVGPGALQGLAQRAVAPPSDGKVEIVPAQHLNFGACFDEWLQTIPDPCSWDPKRVKTSFSPAASEPARVGLATLALARGNGAKGSAAYALCAIAPLRQDLVESALGRQVLARCSNPDIHRRLANLGADLSAFRDQDSSTPLHKAAASHENKATLEALARCCPDWIGARDGAGKLPVELLRGRHADLAVVFDQIGVRDGLKGKRGKRPTPQTQRRL